MPHIIDVHTHLDMLPESPEEALKVASELGVQQMITIGTETKDHPQVLELAEKFFPKVFCSLGIHPHQANEWSEKVRDFFIQQTSKPWVVALGEMGLDYYYNRSPREVQIKAFEEQMALAAELNLPVQIHTREAEADTLSVLQSFKGRVRGILHCFTGTYEMAAKALDLGYFISISGVVTFKKAQALQEVVKKLPLDALTIETDAPFLTPEPHRGKKNTPGYTYFVAQTVAALKSVPLETLIWQTQQNSHTIFPKLIALLES